MSHSLSRHTSGQGAFVFTHREELTHLPKAAQAHEVKLHGGFAEDERPGYGQLYYAMPGAGLLRISADLTTQEILELSPDLQAVNFHSTKIGEFDGKLRLFLPANGEAFVAVLTLDGEVDFILSRPEFAEYANAEVPFRPTDTVLAGAQLWVADGYGANYISTADLATHRWTGLFGGKTEDAHEHGRFGTAHGMNLSPVHHHLAIADRPHSRVELVGLDGAFVQTYGLPAGSRPCGIDYIEWHGRWLAVVGSLDDPQQGRPAPIYILDATTYQLLSTVRPKEELGLELVDHLHNVVWHEHNGRLFLVCQAWKPGHYFVLEMA